MIILRSAKRSFTGDRSSRSLLAGDRNLTDRLRAIRLLGLASVVVSPCGGQWPANDRSNRRRGDTGRGYRIGDRSVLDHLRIVLIAAGGVGELCRAGIIGVVGPFSGPTVLSRIDMIDVVGGTAGNGMPDSATGGGISNFGLAPSADSFRIFARRCCRALKPESAVESFALSSFELALFEIGALLPIDGCMLLLIDGCALLFIGGCIATRTGGCIASRACGCGELIDAATGRSLAENCRRSEPACSAAWFGW